MAAGDPKSVWVAVNGTYRPASGVTEIVRAITAASATAGISVTDGSNSKGIGGDAIERASIWVVIDNDNYISVGTTGVHLSIVEAPSGVHVVKLANNGLLRPPAGEHYMVKSVAGAWHLLDGGTQRFGAASQYESGYESSIILSNSLYLRAAQANVFVSYVEL